MRLTLLAMLSASCTFTYQPRPSRRIAIVADGFGLAYVRDGRMYRDGFLGGGLVEAVAGNPRAEDLADTYYSRRVGGFVLALSSLACFGTYGFVDAFGGVETATGVTLACVVALSLTSALLTASAIPYQYDAVNVFNDDLELQAPTLLEPQAPR